MLLNLHVVIDEALVFCEHTIRKTGVVLEKRLDPALPRIVGNRTQLQQVFVNLVTNAVQAVEPNSGRITIGTFGREDGVEIEVCDNGKGMERAILERIFEPFFRTKPPGEGTGLGLSIVQTIIEKHSGRIAVKSEPARGTAFRIWLPLGAPPQTAVSTREAVSKLAAARP